MTDTTLADKIISYIEDNLDEDLTLDRISDVFNYSKFYIARIFSEHTGRTLYKYIQGRRLTEAARDLVETDKTVLDIAYEAHYSSPQAFSLAFHQVYQCSPLIYRKNGVFYPKQDRIILIHNITAISNSAVRDLKNRDTIARNLSFRAAVNMDTNICNTNIKRMGGRLAA